MSLRLLFLLLIAPGVHAQEELEVCINYHCDLKQQVTISDAEWQVILKPFQQAPANAGQERHRIQESIGLFEEIVGQHTPTYQDLAENKGEDVIGQLDCIAESKNSQHYLQWLNKKGKLKWHLVGGRIKRSPHLFDAHWGAKITELQSNAEYIVDSWYGTNGDMPNIQPLSHWLQSK